MRTEHYRNTAPGVAVLVEVLETHEVAGEVRVRRLGPQGNELEDRAATSDEATEHREAHASQERIRLVTQLRDLDASSIADPVMRLLVQVLQGNRNRDGRP